MLCRSSRYLRYEGQRHMQARLKTIPRSIHIGGVLQHTKHTHTRLLNHGKRVHVYWELCRPVDISNFGDTTCPWMVLGTRHGTWLCMSGTHNEQPILDANTNPPWPNVAGTTWYAYTSSYGCTATLNRTRHRDIPTEWTMDGIDGMTLTSVRLVYDLDTSPMYTTYLLIMTWGFISGVLVSYGVMNSEYILLFGIWAGFIACVRCLFNTQLLRTRHGPLRL